MPTPAFVEALEQRTLLADAVLNWNTIALQAAQAETDHAGPTWTARNLAIVQLAVSDAVAAIDRGFYAYLGTLPAKLGASTRAAVATAAHDTLVALFPNYAPQVEQAYQHVLHKIPNSRPERRGIAVGQASAARMLAARADDGSATVVDYQPSNDPGHWQTTWPTYTSAFGAGWGDVQPFAIRSKEPYLPPPPPEMTSAEYTAAFDEVRSLGALNSTTRTQEQTEIGRFWAYDRLGMGSPVVLYNRIAAAVAQQQHNTLSQNARLLGLLNLALADAAIIAWDAKYAHDLWRPITAIRSADQDGNDQTAADPDWQPLGAPGGSNGPDFTPPFPAYVSGHSTFGAAAFRILARFYGRDDVPFTVTSEELPDQPRSFGSFSEAADENGRSRIYLGIHWSFDDEQGQLAGRKIANTVFATNYRFFGDAPRAKRPAPIISYEIPQPKSLFSKLPITTGTSDVLS